MLPLRRVSLPQEKPTGQRDDQPPSLHETKGTSSNPRQSSGIAQTTQNLHERRPPFLRDERLVKSAATVQTPDESFRIN